MTLKKLSDGRYEVRYDFIDKDGKRRQGRRRFKLRGEAVAFQRELLSGHSAVVRDTPVLSVYGREWLDNRRVLRGLAPLSCSAYRNAIDKLVDNIGDVRVSRVTPHMLEGALARGGYRANSAILFRRVWILMFDDAVRDGYLHSNPARAIAAPRMVPMEITPPDSDTIMRLLNDLRGHWAYVFFLLAATTGCRKSELLGLMWDSVDLDAGTITIRRQRYKVTAKDAKRFDFDGTILLSDTTKGRTARTVRLPEGVVVYLRDLKKARDLSGVASPYVCLNSHGEPPTDNALNDIARAHGMRVHDLRHAHATLLIDAGIPITGVSARLGHSSPAVTVRVYAHALKKQDDAAADVAARFAKDDTKHDTITSSSQGYFLTERSTNMR